ncbi:MAG: transposase [Paludibacter sp.]|nr:transposase [Paludibacter sp.]
MIEYYKDKDGCCVENEKKLIAMYDCKNQQEAKIYFERCYYESVVLSNLKNKYMKSAKKTFKSHIYNIITQIGTNIGNGMAKQTNGKIAKIRLYHKDIKTLIRTAILFFNKFICAII